MMDDPPISESDPGVLQLMLRQERIARARAEAVAERGLRELYERNRQIELLGIIAVAANLAESLEEVFRLTLQTVCETLDWAWGSAYIMRFREREPVLECVTHCAVRATGDPSLFKAVTEQTVFRVNESLPGRVLSTGKLCWIENLSKDGSFSRAQAALGAGLHSGFAFPVLAGDSVVAVLEFFSQHITEPDQSVADLMGQVSVQVGRVVERKRTQDQLMYEATHDALTGLPDRSVLMDRITVAIHHQQRQPEDRFAVLLMDLNRFRLINTSLGHTVGDGLLAQVAARLADALRTQGIFALPTPGRTEDREVLCRFGGDEFALLLDHGTTREAATLVCHTLRQALETPFQVSEREVFLTASIGVTISTSGLASPSQLVQQADVAIQRAKSRGQSDFVFFEPSLSANAVDQLELENALRHALRHEEFELHYQPIVRLASGEIRGFEALIRWNRPGVGLIRPLEFIQVAEESGLIVPIGLWVMREACRTLTEWHQKYPRDERLRISVNLSARQFSQSDLVEQVAGIFAETDTWPSSLLLEITETVSMEDVDRTIAILNQLAMLGVRASIDDFGTGFSSLSHLHRLPAQMLKIDRSFVSRMDEDRDSRAIVMTIINLAEDLGMDVVAEGIETEIQAELLKGYDCKYGQGFFFSMPLTRGEAGRLIESNSIAHDV
jgi:diguanylate cyclase (GGDEF)-like protein